MYIKLLPLTLTGINNIIIFIYINYETNAYQSSIKLKEYVKIYDEQT